MRLIGVLAIVLVALAIGACGGTETRPAATARTTPLPDIEATVVAEVQSRIQAAAVRVPAGVVLSPGDRTDIVDFAAAHGLLVTDWEEFHAALDSWREALTACEALSVEVALSGFAATMGGVVVRAGTLPRSVGVRGLADTLVAAGEGEAEALRQLRDRWSPGDPAAFGAVDLARSSAMALRREVRDDLSDLQATTSDKSRAQVAFLAIAVDDLSTDWDAFRRDYDLFRTDEPDLSSIQMVTRLSRLVDQFRGIVVAVRDLPANDVTAGVSAVLAQAVEGEDLALRNLRGTFQRSEAVAAGPAAEPAVGLGGEFDFGDGALGSGEVPAGPPAGPAPSIGEASFVARDPTLFDAFDTQLASSNALRRQAYQLMAGVVEETSSETRNAVSKFAEQHVSLVRDWDRAHDEYDEWRRTEGGCDRSAAAQTLAGFTSDFAAITRSAREVPGGTLLGPLRELLVEAAELEEEGLRDLRNSWRPFDVQVHKLFEGRRNSAARLLRQVAVGLSSLLAEHDIPPPAQ